MSNILMLVKILTALYQARKIGESILITELRELLEQIPESPRGGFDLDKKVESSIRNTIEWVLEKPKEETIIKSTLVQRCNDFLGDAPETKNSIELGLEEIKDEEKVRKLIYVHIDDIRRELKISKIEASFKKKMKDFHFGDIRTIPKKEWLELAEIINDKLVGTFEEDNNEVISSADTDNKDELLKIIELAKIEAGEESIIKTPFQGLNLGLSPDGGLGKKFLLINALTNRGKSLTVAHLLSGVALYNKPMLRDRSKIPTVVMDSAEDTMGLVIGRLYKLIMSVKHGVIKEIKDSTSEEIVETIVGAFKETGWRLIINHVEANKDNFANICKRVRKLEMNGHEIIHYFYDYLAMMELDGITGDSKSDKLQVLFRKVRSFFLGRGCGFTTPHQLNPEAKRFLRESDSDSEVFFVREVGGKSMTETSTKLTNEVDTEITIHVAKTETKAYFCYYVGKQRGEGSPEEFKFGFYELDPVLGLKHDILGKPMFRKSLSHRINENGESVPDFDFIGE